MKVVKLIPRNVFAELKAKYNMDKRIRKLKTWDLLLLHLYSPLTNKSSIRPLLDSFNQMNQQFYHLNINAAINRSTFSDANQSRDYHFFRDLFSQTYKMYRSQLNSKVRRKIEKQINLIDSTLYTLSEKRFKWAHENRKGNNQYQKGMRIHCVFDVNASVPRDIIIERGNVNDIVIARQLSYREEEIYVGDRAYFCFKWFNQVDRSKAFFVTRYKDFRYRQISEKPLDNPNITNDIIVKATGFKSRQHYEGPLRLVTFYDAEKKREFTYITNILNESAEMICDLYKIRWDIEIFFRELKHYMKLKTFLGTSKNAIGIQIYSYAIAYILLQVFWGMNSIALSWYRFLELTKTFANIPFEFTQKGLNNSALKCKTIQLAIGFQT